MNRPTDRSIFANLVLGILTISVIGSPGDAFGQTDGSSVPPVVKDGIPVRAVEALDVPTRLMWTLQMVLAPGALAHISPLYAYDPQKLAGVTVHPDRIGRVAIVRKCGHDADPRPDLSLWPGELSWCASYESDTLDAFRSAYHAPFADSDPVYFATTYPIPRIEPEKRFFVEQPPRADRRQATPFAKGRP